MAILKVFSTHPVSTVFCTDFFWFAVYFFYFFFLFSKFLGTFPFFKQVDSSRGKPGKKTFLCKSAAVSPKATCFNSSQYLQPAAKQEHPEGFLSLSEESV